MTKYIQLELWKNKLSTYLDAALWIFIVGLGFCFFFAFISQIETASGWTSSPKDIAIFTEWSNYIVFISALFSNVFGMLPASFEWSMFPGLLSISGIYGLFAASVGLVAMCVGFWKKSLVATVVAAIILIAPFRNIISNFTQHSTIIQLIGMGILLAAGLLIFRELSSKVNKMEATERRLRH